MAQFQLSVQRGNDSSNAILSSAIIAPNEMPQVKNVVSTMNVLCKLDLKEIVVRSRNSEYNPKRFAAVIMRIREPKSTALIFGSGKIVITGSKNEESSRVSARKFVRILQKLDFPAKLNDYKIVNMVGCIDVGFPVRLEAFAHSQSQYSSYEPELFPGLIYRMSEPKVVILVFVSGKIVLTGAKSKNQIDRAFELVWPNLCKFRKHYEMDYEDDDDDDDEDGDEMMFDGDNVDYNNEDIN